MTVAGLPDRETLLSWMSAFLDGELPAENEAILLEAMEADPALLTCFEELSAAMEPAISPRAELSKSDAQTLTRDILLAVAPKALLKNEQSPDASALQWASLASDDALDDASAALLEQACETPQTAREVAAFVGAQAEVGDFLARWPEQKEMKASLAPLQARIDAGIQRAEERQMAWSAAMDGELAAQDIPSFTTAAEAREALAFMRNSEAVGATLRMAVADPAAQRAGAAALQVIAAHAAQDAEEKAASHASVEPPSAAQAPRGSGWWRFVPVLGFASAALALTLWSADESPTGSDAHQAEPRVAATDMPTEAWAPLADNTAQIESLDSGSHVAAVFETDASQITVIWVAEPEDEPQTETGT